MKVEFSNINKAIEPVDKVKVTSSTMQSIVPYGDNNQLPDDLLSLIYESSTHQSIIEFKKTAVIGNGLSISRNGDKIKDLVRDLSWEEFIERTINDLVIFGGFSWQVIWNKTGTKINGLYHQPFNQVRSGNFNEEGVVDMYYLKRDWSYGGNHIEIKPFNEEAAKEDGKQLFVYKEYSSINEFYPIPSYYSAFNYIKVEKELSKFYHNIVTNGMFPSLIMKVKSEMSDELKADFVKNIRDHYQGGEKANKVITLFSDKDTESVEVEPIEAVSNDELFDSLNEIVTNRIINAHRIPRSLVGVEKSLGLSSNGEELRMSFEYFNNTVVKNLQSKFIGAFKSVARVNFKSVNMEFLPMDLITQSFTEQTLLAVLTRDELRARIGYEPLNNNDNDESTVSDSSTTEGVDSDTE